jgi:hypothetical protein
MDPTPELVNELVNELAETAGGKDGKPRGALCDTAPDGRGIVSRRLS